jgi:hypothetical protein
MNLEDRYKGSKDNVGNSRFGMSSQLTADHSKLNIDRIPARYTNVGKLYTSGDTSRLNLDSIPKKYHG